MDSDNTWTAVGKGGRAVTFPSDAAAAFSGKSFTRGPCVVPRSEFPADAAAAFGRKPRGGWKGVPETETPYVSKASNGPKGVPEFDSAAAAAFGGKSTRRGATTRHDRNDFPDAFGKKKSVFTAAAEVEMSSNGADGYRLSAFSRKRAEAAELAALPPEPKQQTYEEMFPSLGGSAPHIKPKATPSSGKPTLADMMRKRAEEETKEEAKKAALERSRAERERIEAAEAARLRNLRVGRMGNYAAYSSQFDTEESEVYTPGDLDYDAYGVKRKELTLPEPSETASDSSSESDVTAEADEY